MQDGYPESVAEVIDDRMRFNSAAFRAVRTFARSNPWKGSVKERKGKFLRLNQFLAAAYQKPAPELVFGDLDGSHSGSSHYIPALHRIVLVGKLSVVTYLHEFAHSRGKGERRACEWSINLFKRIWPEQYGRLRHVGHTLIRGERSSGRAFPEAQYTGDPESRQ